MPAVNRSPKAREDLLEIFAFEGTRSHRYAQRLKAEIDKRSRLLARLPLMGRAREDLAPSLRSVVVDAYLIFYRPTDSGIEIVRVLHGAQNITPDLFIP